MAMFFRKIFHLSCVFKAQFFFGPGRLLPNAPKPCAALRFMNRFPWPALAVLLSAYSLGHVIEEDVDSWKLMSHEKNPALLSMKYWLVNRDPCNGLL